MLRRCPDRVNAREPNRRQRELLAGHNRETPFTGLRDFSASGAEVSLRHRIGTTLPERTKAQEETMLERSTPKTQPLTAVIVGTGFGGIGMAIKLRQAGITDFVMLEKSGQIGGTWRDNTYPGAACDVPSPLYSFSFEQDFDWPRFYSGQRDIHAYQQHCVAKYKLMPHVRLNTEVRHAAFDEQRGL